MDVAVVRVFHALAGVLAPTFSVWCQIDGAEVGAIRSFALGAAVVDVGRGANVEPIQVGGALTEATSPVRVRAIRRIGVQIGVADGDAVVVPCRRIAEFAGHARYVAFVCRVDQERKSRSVARNTHAKQMLNNIA